jgi:ribosomal protein L37AE/L43A
MLMRVIMIALVVGVGLAAVAGLTGVLAAGRSARRREERALAEALPHPHYCAECDQEWPHSERTCLEAWALLCPACGGSRATRALP